MLLAGIVVWNRMGRSYVWPVLLAGAASYFNTVTKLLVGRPRPPSELVTVSTDLTTFSFPSGHTFSAAMLLGTLLILVIVSRRSRLFKAGAGVVAAGLTGLVGASRVFLGVHWPSDVLGSCLWAGVWLIPLYCLVRRYCPANN